MSALKFTGGILTIGLLVTIGGFASAQFGLAPALDKPWLPLIYSFAAALATFLFTCLLGKLTQDLNAGTRPWTRRIRKHLRVEEGQTIHEAIWTELILQLLAWCVLIWLILQIWHLESTAESIVGRFANSGFTLGSITVVPGQIMLGVIIFTLLLSVTRWLKGQLESRWLLRTPLDAATRDAVATMFGYLTFVVVLLIGLSVGGFDVTNLAIVAGALGVGIGFGLQNIVNNFVSGIVLLFERPVRVGDYITVAATEGWVRKQRLRSTEIETLDRMHIVVPNAELISNHLVNWTLRDRYFRITVKVGVAYGSDTDLVRQLLLECAEAHPQIINEATPRVPGPFVLFRGFGDSSLDFELKAHVRDVERRYNIISDLNFAIDRSFREHNVTIPFPQRDLWFKNALANAEHHHEAPPQEN